MRSSTRAPADERPHRFEDSRHALGTVVSRGALLDGLPRDIVVEVTQREFRGRYRSRLAAIGGEFVTLTGLRSDDRAFFLPLGSSVRLGFGLSDGWGEISGEIAGWSVGAVGGKVMIRCASSGRVSQRRQSGRTVAELAVSCAGSDGHIQVGVTKDLSRGGLRAALPMALREGENIRVELLPTGEEVLRLSGEAVWQQTAADGSGGCHVGIRLHRAEPPVRRRYLSVLAHLARKASPAVAAR